MTGVIDPSSFKIWNASGEDVSDAGAKSRDPTTDKEWAAVSGAAVAVMEAGNLLMLPGRAYDADWIKRARAMSDAAATVKAAADAKDGKRVFDTGGKLYETCGACHEKILHPLRQRRKACATATEGLTCARLLALRPASPAR